MEQYYLATADGQTEGPYFFESLETFYTHGKITKDTLICVAGGQQWVKFGEVLEQNAQVEKPSWGKSQERTEELPTNPELIPTVEGLFCVVGVIALIASVILLVYSIEAKHTGIGFIYLLSGAFSCLWCFWCAKVIKLLSHVVGLLTVIVKKAHNGVDKG